ncbi:MAG: UDP-N-acetylglucosamine 1-carboxyvinyltransferase [Acidobacteriota bacterium]
MAASEGREFTRFVIRGGRRLSGRYPVQGNKNAALPLLAASILHPGPVEFRRIPAILDVERMAAILDHIGVRVERQPGVLTVDGTAVRSPVLAAEQVEQLRGSILLWSALAARFGRVDSGIPGGCPIGRRAFDVHWKVFRSAGFEIVSKHGRFLILKTEDISRPEVYLDESSVTATENALILYAGLGGGTIWNPAREPHVLALIEFLRRIGCELELGPICFRVRRGPHQHAAKIMMEVPADYIDAGTAAIAAGVTGGQVELAGVEPEDLLGVRSQLEGFGLEFEETRVGVLVDAGEKPLRSPDKVTAGLWPGFPTDLTSIAVVLATRSRGLCLIHDWLYESRMFFVDKLVRMGARITVCDPHRVIVEGPVQLRGTHLESPDIRAGMALLVAGLAASGTTRIERAEVVHRGYERVAERFAALGADISVE